MLANPNMVLLFFLLGAVFFSILVNRLLLKFSRTLGIRSEDDMLRWSPELKPSLGGLSIFILFLVAVSSVTILGVETRTMDREMMFGMFLATTVGFIIGLADDAYNTRPFLKLLGQILTANILITTGIYIEIAPDLAINYVFTVVWVIGIMNSINMLDNMDGIAGSVAASILLAVFLLVYIIEGPQDASLIIIGGVLAGIVGFLVFNWHPSRMFMGDTGSQFLGAFLAAISIIFLWKFRMDDGGYFQIKQFLLPLLAFIIPIIDTSTVFIHRLRRRQSPFVGGRDHTTHHLVYLGLSEGQVTSLILAISLFSVFIVYLLYQVTETWSNLYTVVVLVYALLLFGIFQMLYNLGAKRKASLENMLEDGA